MNTENTEEMMNRAAQMLAFGVSVDDVTATFRAKGTSEEVIFLVAHAAKILAK